MSQKEQADLLDLLGDAMSAEEVYRAALRDEREAAARSKEAYGAACHAWGVFFDALDQSFPQGSACQDLTERRILVQGGIG